MEFAEAFDPYRAIRHGWAALKLAPFPLFLGALGMWGTAGGGGGGGGDDIARAIMELQGGDGGGGDAPSYDNFDDWGDRLEPLRTSLAGSLNDLVGRVQDVPPGLEELLNGFGSGAEVGVIAGIVAAALAFTLFCGGIMMVIRSFIHVGYLRLHEQVVREGVGDFGPLFSGADLLLPMVLWKLLKTAIGFGVVMVAASPGLAVAIAGIMQGKTSFAIAGGVLAFLLMVPVSIYVSLGLSLGAHCLVLERLTPMQALERSWGIASGRRFDLFVFLFAQALVNFGAAILGLLACCIGVVVTVPVGMATVDVAMTEAFLLFTSDQATRESFKLPTLAEEML